jgi:hypothetical protein
MQEENERDTHFMRFAELLLEDLFNTGFDTDGYRSGDDSCKLVAQRAYDLVMHTLYHSIDSFDPNYDYELLEGIPDITTWPESEA